MSQSIESMFEKIGARAKVALANGRSRYRAWNGRTMTSADPEAVVIDVRHNDVGEYFQIMHRRDVALDVIDARRHDRHLLLMAREHGRTAGELPSKFLCGHDERAWFVAAIPETAAVSDVQDAKDALKPAEVWEAIRAYEVPRHKRDLRRTKAFVRQGEWFFIPRPNLRIEGKPILRNEPIRRGSGKPHMCQFLCRFGGEQVWVCPRYPNGLTYSEYRGLDPYERKRHGWQTMMRDAHVYARGAIRHSDHKTVWLPDWHEVVMNTETQSRAMRHVAFLD